MNCSDARGRLYPYLDGELAAEEKADVGRHLAGCASCSSAFEGDRALFSEIRRQAESTGAPAGLRGRISARLGHEAPAAAAPAASRPWPFARALVPAAAAALLVAVLVTFFSQPLEAETIGRRAIAWHDASPAQLVSLTSAQKIEDHYASFGRKGCLHSDRIEGKLKYDYKAACVEKKGPAGNETCWWTAACPKTGCRLTHACFPAPEGLEKVWPQGERRVVRWKGRTVVMGHRRNEVCLFVFDTDAEAQRFLAILNAPRE